MIIEFHILGTVRRVEELVPGGNGVEYTVDQ